MGEKSSSSSKEKKKKSSSSSSSSRKSKRVSSSHRSSGSSRRNKKRVPEWRRQIDSLAMNAQVQFDAVRSKMENNAAYKQRVYNQAGALLTLFVLMIFLVSHNGGVGGTHSSLRVTASLKAGKAGGGSRHSKANTGTLYLSKREKERQELGFDVSGSDLLSVKRRYGTRAEFEKAQKNSRGKLSPKEEQCFKNMPVQVTRDNPDKFTVYSPRKVFDQAVLQRAHKTLGWTEETDLKKASMALKGVPRVVFRQLKEGRQYYDMVASLGRIGSKKKTQLSTLRNHVRKFKCSFESLHIQPRSYDMNKPNDCKKFFAHEDKGRMWVLKSCKSGEGSKGMGISVIDDLTTTRNEWGECQENAFNYVAQEYIEQPLLLINRKFDMRAYLFVASTKPYIVYFNPGYIRRSLAEYKPKSTEKNDVLTNYHVQMNREDFSPENAMWNFPQFMQYLKDENLCEACGDIEIQLAKISKLVFDAGRSYYKRWSGSFQIVGLDFMMDRYLNVQFIEGNVSPGIGNHGLKWKRELMDDLVTMMYEQTIMIHERPSEFDLRIGERVYGKHGNYWELVVNEHHEKCNKSMKFNPCDELKLEGVVDEDAPSDGGDADDSGSGDDGGGDDDGDES